MTDEELARLFALLRVPSVSALPAHAADMERAARLVAAEITRAGGVAEVRTGAGHPLVVGEVMPPRAWVGEAPRVIVYGHYDVQPPGDPALWTSPPFAPEVRGGNLYARGASDDKGNLFMLLTAIARLAAGPGLPVHATIVVDGEEETSGEAALAWVRDEAPDAAAALIFDAPMAAPGRPAICTGLRGLLYRRVSVRTGDGDAHSGIFGGVALNAVHALAAILERLRPRDGALDPRLAEGTAPPRAEEEAAWADLPGGADLLAGAGLRPADAGAAAEFHARTGAAPSLDVHGIAAGEPDAVKTNIPAAATATLSLRLAPGQDPARIGPVLDALIREAAPPGAEVAVEDLGAARPVLLDPRSPALATAAAAIERATGWPCAFVRTGFSIPVVAAFADRGIPTVLTGFALPDDAFHAPDEHLRFSHLETGTRAAMEILTALGGR